jgi:alcohol dehydrogenase
MYPRAAVTRLAALARSGVLDLGQYEITEFGLGSINEAVTHAAANGGPFRMTVVRP